MIQITRIVYVYEDNSLKIEHPTYLSVNSIEQMEKIRKLLKDKHNCKNVNFAYEEC